MIETRGTNSTRVRQELDGANVFVIHDFLAPEECAHLIAQGEAPAHIERGGRKAHPV